MKLLVVGRTRFAFPLGRTLERRFEALSAELEWRQMGTGRTSDERFALYVEERAPQLRQELISAVQEAHTPEAERMSVPLSARLIGRAENSIRPLQQGMTLERPRMKRAGGTLGALAVAAVAMLLLGPEGLRNSARMLFVPFGTAQGGPAFTPGSDVDDTAILVKYTYTADLTLDGKTDTQDLSVFSTKYDGGASTGRFWFEGDSTYDGLLNNQDLSIFGTAYDPNKPAL